MLFYYIRHGDPIYDPNSLTPLGHRQAEAVAKRLALHGLDKIYSSTSNRAMLTAEPTAEILKRDVELVDFANESYAWEQLTYVDSERRAWLFHSKEGRRLFVDPEVRALGHEWYRHPAFRDYDYERGMNRILTEADKFFGELGFVHQGRSGVYKITEPKYNRVAMFAHQGFGLAFLSTILDIPYPDFSLKFDFTHTGVTVIDFSDDGNGFAVPKVMTLSSEAHIYKEGLPTRYSNGVYY